MIQIIATVMPLGTILLNLSTVLATLIIVVMGLGVLSMSMNFLPRLTIVMVMHLASIIRAHLLATVNPVTPLTEKTASMKTNVP